MNRLQRMAELQRLSQEEELTPAEKSDKDDAAYEKACDDEREEAKDERRPVKPVLRRKKTPFK